MIGLLFFIPLAIYFWVISIISKGTFGWAKNRDKNPWLWSSLMAIALLAPVFWDFIPIHVLHKYKCATEAGFTVYKTPEQWKAENPSVAKTLVPFIYDNSFERGDVWGYKLNQRFVWEVEPHLPVWNVLYKREDRIVDIKNREVMAKIIDFYSDTRSITHGPPMRLRDYKIWMGTGKCWKGDKLRWSVDDESFGSFATIIENLKD